MKALVTGLSGTGKSSVIAALSATGRRAIDLDADGWSAWARCDCDPTGANPGHDWLWDEGRIDRLLRIDADGPLFVAGCAPNTGCFVPRFDRIVLLSAPIEVMLIRVRLRAGNAYGKTACETARIVGNTREVEPRLRRIAAHEVDAPAPLDTVVRIVLRVAGEA